MDSTLWKINDRNASEFIRDVRLTLYNQESDQLTFNVDGEAFDSAEVYAYGEAISLYKGNVRWFAGVVTSGIRFGSSASERHDYEVTGLWWYLDNLTFEQEWKVKGSSNLSKSHVVLGRNIDNDIVPIGTVIREALDYAINMGAPFAYDAGELGSFVAEPPTDEQNDLTCSEVIRKMLRWAPDTVCWFDYSEAIPVLHFTRRSAAAAVQLPCIGDAEQIDIRSREDLVKNGVIINYERIDTIDGERIPAISQDIYPGGIGSGFDTATFTVNIAGAQLSTQSVEVVSEPLGDPNTEAWWTERVPELATKGELLFLEEEMLNAIPQGAYILKNGQVPKWTNKSAWQTTFGAVFSWSDPDTESKVAKGEFTYDVMLTTAESKVYTRELSYTAPDTYPSGLAQMLYDALSVVHWEGSFQTVENECAGGINPGNVLNLADGLPAWATMRAAIQQVEFDLDAGRTSIQFGPAERLGLADYIALLNANRLRITHYSGDSRSSGKSGGSDDLDSGGGTPNTNTTAAEPTYSKLVLTDGAEDAKTIIIDTADVAAGKVFIGQSDGKSAKFGTIKFGV